MEKFLRTSKRKPGGIIGDEKINFQDRQKRIFEGTLQDIANLQGEIIKIGEVTYANLNSLGSSTTLDIVFSDAKEANEFFIRGFAKVSTAFTNQVYGYEGSYGTYSTNKILDVTITKVSAVSSSSTPSFPNSEEQDINARITLAITNAQDWDAGVLDIYIEVKKYPTLE